MTTPMDARPPRLAVWLVDLCASPEEADGVLGDLREEFGEVAEREGNSAARWWYRRHALKTMLHLVFGPFRERPWWMAGVGLLALLFTWPLAWTINRAAQWLVVNYEVYSWVSAAFFWQLISMAPLFLVGFLVARVAKRPVAAAVAMLAMMLVLTNVVDPLFIRAPRSLGFWMWRSMVMLSVWGTMVAAGAVLGRKLLPRRRRQAA